METSQVRPYGGIRIIDLTRELGLYAARLFADLGAEVIRVEPPQGGPDRPVPAGAGGAEQATTAGVQFAFLNLNKKSVVIDRKTASGRAVFEELVASSQVVMCEPGQDEPGLIAELMAIPGRRVVTVVSYFGTDGPYAGFTGSDLIAQSLGGIAYLSGEPGKPPLALPGKQSVFVTSLYTAAATAIALWDSERSGVSHVLDVSAQECIAHSLQNAVQVYDLENRILARGGEGIRDATESAFVCKDGYVFLAAPLALSASWAGLLNWMEQEGFDGAARLREAQWADRPKRATAPMRAEFRELFERFIADKTKAELGAEALRRKIVMAPVSRVSDLHTDPQLIFRRYFQKVAMPGLGREVPFPGAPYRLSEPVWRIDRGVPALGEHDGDVLGRVTSKIAQH